MVLLITDKALFSAEDLCAMAIDGRNAFNEMKRQKILDLIHLRFPELSIFIETWYLNPSPIWVYMDANSVGIIWRSQGFSKETQCPPSHSALC